MVTIFGTTYYTIGAGLLVLALLAPLFYLFARWLLRPNVEGEPRRKRLLAEGGVTLGLLLIAAVVLHWDVYLIGQRAKVLCEQTGLVVHTAVPARGFVGSASIGEWSAHGFEFVETDYLGTKHRYLMTPSGPTRQIVDTLESKYRLELIDDPRGHNGATDSAVIRRGARILTLDGNQVLAELVEFTIDYGWADRAAIDWTGFVANPKTCGRRADGKVTVERDRLGTKELILATLLTE